jgi:membrane fusion protein, multidrug efflux system
MNKRIRYAVLLTLAALVFTGCGSKDTKATVEPLAVAVTEAKTGQITAVNAASAQIEPVLQVPVMARVPGRVTAVHKEMGAQVKAGDLLAELEDRDATAQLAQAQAAAAQAEAQRAEADRQHSRLAELFKAGAVSKQQVEQVQTQLTLAGAQVTAAYAQLDMARSNWENTRITAPADGILASRSVEPGTLVGAGTPLFTLVDLSTVVVKAGVAERDVNLIQPGSTVPVVVPALSDREFSGKVEAVSPAMDRQTRTYQVKLTMANTDGALKGGMFAQARFPVKEQQGILLPVSALVERNGETYVFVTENNTAKQVKVTVSVTADDMVAVEGIEPGTPVVTAGQNRLYDGAPVKVGRSTTP